MTAALRAAALAAGRLVAGRRLATRLATVPGLLDGRRGVRRDDRFGVERLAVGFDGFPVGRDGRRGGFGDENDFRGIGSLLFLRSIPDFFLFIRM